ncbi:hypothetical protein DPMN_142220 [Dreissena polymorpha]|uniref:Uncharacterized protein n=1 Tax=Dreissena polymorpha TaxID=45954 RepID=A0A9D4GGU8_DREPO|nr:hypothetical protein DPMN_142220 [Dreissena polymorpha]
MGIVDFTTPCEEGWSELNVFAIVFGSVGDALLIVTCIVTIVIASKQLFEDLGTEYTSKIIESFLLVIPNNCELILPTSEKLTSSATCRMKEITLQLEKEVNVDKHKLKLYKLKTEEDEYYVIAEVPTVLTVISLLSQTLRGKTIAGVVRQKFQLLYQSELIPHKLNNTVQFVTCKGKDDIARALFEVAKALFNAAKEPAESEKGKAPQTTVANMSKEFKSPESDSGPGSHEFVNGLDFNRHYPSYLREYPSFN